MPIAKIYVTEGHYDDEQLSRLGQAVQTSLEQVLKTPPEDYFRLIHVLPGGRFVHTPSFIGMTYTDGLVILELTFISGRSKETRLELLRQLNERVVEATGISPDDLMITLYEVPGENISFGRGQAQRAFISNSQ